VTGLRALLAPLVEGGVIGVFGPDASAIAETLLAAGLDAVAPDAVSPPACAVVVALDHVSGSSVLDARAEIARLTAAAERAVVFSTSAGVERFPAWWDELFAREGFDVIDALRTPLWDDPSWDAGELTTLALYIRREAPRPPLAASLVPRSAVHPGAYVRARRAEVDLQRVASLDRHPTAADGDPGTVVRRMLQVREQAAEAARAELAAMSGRAALDRQRQAEQTRRDLERVAEETAAARHASATAQAAQKRADAARARVERESQMLRDEVASLAVNVAEAPRRLRRSSPAWIFGTRAADALSRRLERSALGVGTALSRLPGAPGRASRRAVAAYRSVAGPFVEEARALFDETFYVAQRPGVAGTGIDPLLHYLHDGWRQGLDPHPVFDTVWYMRHHPEAATRRGGPLEHFIAVGGRNGCDPHPLFDVDWYLRRAPHVAASGENPLAHFLRDGWRENRDPHALFETARYRAINSDVEASSLNPLVHYVRYGWQEGRSPGGLFDAEWYVEHHPEALTSGLAPYRYYLEVGVGRGDPPSAWAAKLTEDPGPSGA